MLCYLMRLLTKRPGNNPRPFLRLQCGNNAETLRPAFVVGRLFFCDNVGEVIDVYSTAYLPQGFDQGYPASPYTQRLMQMQQPQAMQPQPRDGLIRVTGMDGAKAYQLPPNSSVALFDGGQDVFYVKTTDGAGFPTIKAYAFAPLQEQQPPPAQDYVTRAEFDQLKEMIANGKQPVRGKQPSTDDAK